MVSARAIRNAVLLAMPSTKEEIRKSLSARIPGVIEVHHVHAWGLTAEKPLLTLHANVDTQMDLSVVVTSMKTLLNDDFGISHSTIEIETDDCADE